MYKTVILPVVLYGCETWFPITGEEHKRMMFENRILRRILGHKREEVVGGCRRLHTRGIITCMLHQVLFGLLNRG
jgi:hypothetical protein